MDIFDLRNEYKKGSLNREDLNENPFAQFKKWFDEALSCKLEEPNAMDLATVNENGEPNIRTVLLKSWDEKGFVFFTNYTSAKANDISKNPNAALHFLWLGLERQLKILGTAEKISSFESLKYFLSRPSSSRLGAWVSRQSSVITSRSILEMKFEEMKNKFKDGKIPLPDFWGGFRVKPKVFEFWQGRPSRLHDRFRYTLESDSKWVIERLAP
ncbi:MAG: pyridoxamine 5'-phosphate oxidase [Opitutales bacterium]|nr:pyridoxamine 5'-phosphate oxidase [Opitutales bacterium]